ncbi:hypothetical protein [Pedobacter aquatilis]|uniref:hypothetical protein n=1 Tax=Pedobacter aquatilis TaxID=351343 RepID=UPI00292EF99E|nr:hypothetical protein [Pedobacter aquatilis]
MTEKELYNSLLPLVELFEKYKAKQLTYVSADDAEMMRLPYLNVQKVYPNVLPRLFQSSCPTCILNTLEQFIAIYDRLKFTFHQPESDKSLTAKKQRKS